MEPVEVEPIARQFIKTLQAARIQSACQIFVDALQKTWGDIVDYVTQTMKPFTDFMEAWEKSEPHKFRGGGIVTQAQAMEQAQFLMDRLQGRTPWNNPMDASHGTIPGGVKVSEDPEDLDVYELHDGEGNIIARYRRLPGLKWQLMRNDGPE